MSTEAARADAHQACAEKKGVPSQPKRPLRVLNVTDRTNTSQRIPRNGGKLQWNPPEEDGVPLKGPDPGFQSRTFNKLNCEVHPRATAPKPFSLLTSTRGEKKEEAFQKKIRLEGEEQKKMRNFVAQPMLHPDYRYQFRPRAKKPPTEWISPDLWTAARHTKREAFEQALKRKEAEAKREAEERAVAQAVQDAEDLKKMRQEAMTFRARPIGARLRRNRYQPY